MANYATLKAAIQQAVKENHEHKITGSLLQQSLLAMVNSLGAEFQFAGVATPTTNPGTPDYNVAYIAGPGTYQNMGGSIVPPGYIGIIAYNGSWEVQLVPVGGGDSSDPEAVKYTEQSLTDAQKEQARENIGAASSADVESTYAKKTELSKSQRVTDSLNEAVNEGDIYLEKIYDTAYIYDETLQEKVECKWAESGIYPVYRTDSCKTMEAYLPGGPGGTNLRIYKRVNGSDIPVLFMGWLMEYDEAFPGTGIYLRGNPDIGGYGVYDAIKGEWIDDFGNSNYWPQDDRYKMDINEYFADAQEFKMEGFLSSSLGDCVRVIDETGYHVVQKEIMNGGLVERKPVVQADWNAYEGSPAAILNKPVIKGQFENTSPTGEEVEGDIRIQEDETEHIDYENGGMPTKDGFLITIHDEMNSHIEVYQATPTQVNYGTEEDPDYRTEYEKGTLILHGRMYFDELLDGQYVNGFYFTNSNNHIVSGSPRFGGGRYIPYTSIFGSDPITAIIAEGSNFDLVCCSPTGGFIEKFGNDFYVRKPYPGKTDEVSALNDIPVSSRGVFNEIHWPMSICQNNDTLKWNSYYYMQGTHSYLESDLTLKIEEPNTFRGRNDKIILNLEIDTNQYTPALSFTDNFGNPIYYWKNGKSPSSITQSGFYTIVFELRGISGSAAQIVGSIEEWAYVS